MAEANKEELVERMDHTWEGQMQRNRTSAGNKWSIMMGLLKVHGERSDC